MACAAATAQTEAPPASATVLTADKPTKTRSGATFIAPKEWSLRTTARFVSVRAPEGDMTLAIVDVSTAADAAGAVAQAWKLYRPDAHHPVRLISPLAPQNGWDESTQIEYETSPNERAAIKAFAHRSGQHWTVLIADGNEGTAAKRGAAIAIVIESLSAPGYTRENFTGRSAHPLDAARIAELKTFVETAMRELHVPGISIGLYDRGHVVFEGGFGVRELGKPGRVDANTLYMVGSDTKGMSTLLLARLVDRGRISWDERVTRAYPAFRLGDAATTQRVLIKHLVCACTGLPRQDLQQDLNTNARTPASATFVQLARTQPTSPFGEVFQYSNPMASAAGYIGGHLVYPDRELGAAYDAAMQNLIFDPLGMSHTTLSMSRALADPNHASPHGSDIHGHVAVATMGPNDTIVPYRPAGGAWSSVDDMLKYVEDELTAGKLPNGTRLISAENVLARRTPTVPLGENSYYGMGLMVDKTWGVPVVHHAGDLAGFHSDWFAIPDAGVGAVILTNGDHGDEIRAQFMRRILEVLYDGRPEAAAQISAAAGLAKAIEAKRTQRLVVPAAAGVASKLATRYVNADLGHIDVRRKGGDVVFDFGSWSTTMASRVNDDKTVSFVAIDPGVVGVYEFVVGSRDGRRTLTIRDAQHEYVYTESEGLGKMQPGDQGT